jgi:hypothetical protein
VRRAGFGILNTKPLSHFSKKREYVLIRFLLVVAFATMTPCLNAEPPPDQPFEEMNWPASLKKPPTKGITLGNFRITFEKTSLDDVVRAVGSGEIRHQGDDAGTSLYWICYSKLRKGYSDNIWLISDSEMGGTGHAVTGITAKRTTNSEASADCPELPMVFSDVSFDFRIDLGAREKSLESILGAPSHREGSWQAFNFAGKKSGNCEGGFDVMNWLITISSQGLITSIYAGQITSC